MMTPKEIQQRVEHLSREMVKLGAGEPLDVCFLSSLVQLAAILHMIPVDPEKESVSFHALRLVVAEQLAIASQILEPEEEPLPQVPLN